jgi:superfamily II DNA helicase RecQ
VPAYVIFADKTLDDLLDRRPRTPAELGACHGIGPAKLEGFGEELLAVIAAGEDRSASDGSGSGNSSTKGSDRPIQGQPREAEGGAGGADPGQPAGIESAEGPDGLNERLRSWRMDQAREQDVPAYRIFSNKTLDDLCARLPTTDEELLACSGIGPAKLESFGAELLAVIGEALDGIDPSAPGS